MSHTIWKYPLINASTVLSLPVGAKILDVQAQYGIPTMWALVYPSAGMQSREFVVYGTGHTVRDPERLEHISTFQMGELVFHVFEVKDRVR